ncbi:DNA endonuclease RBBP8 [Trichinella pseudospiralis]|uniref:DNA endonuclease RBBP8 n=1 Tax=Trichinella pseudospiralis TaxID=6337 RepID=A0A0V1FXX8_TRIPS|nr:DNA endonuclease RBBP8 [Trichinella pseudospiralis]
MNNVNMSSSDFMSSDNFNSKILPPLVEDEDEAVQNILPTTPDAHAKNFFLTKAEYSPELFSSLVKRKTKRCLIFDFDEFNFSDDIENFDLHSNLELQVVSPADLNEIRCSPDKVSTSHENYALKSVSVDPLLSSSFDSVPVNEATVPYKYINEPVKSKRERKKLHGHACHCCRNYVDKLYLDEEEKAKRLKEVGRHRALHPRPRTPEHFWDVGFPSTPEIEERSLIYRLNCLTKLSIALHICDFLNQQLCEYTNLERITAQYYNDNGKTRRLNAYGDEDIKPKVEGDGCQAVTG